jgi:hypothetical protein
VVELTQERETKAVRGFDTRAPIRLNYKNVITGLQDSGELEFEQEPPHEAHQQLRQQIGRQNADKYAWQIRRQKRQQIRRQIRRQLDGN